MNSKRCTHPQSSRTRSTRLNVGRDSTFTETCMKCGAWRGGTQQLYPYAVPVKFTTKWGMVPKR
jgi:hypothetical protein